MDSIPLKLVVRPLAELFELINSGSISSTGPLEPECSAVNTRKLVRSLYRGDPVGHLVLRETPQRNTSLGGAEDAQPKPHRLVIGGWQRLLSLYEALHGRSGDVTRNQVRRIRIAFNPIEERFAVSGATIYKDPEFISDIADLCGSPSLYAHVVNKYLETLPAHTRNEPDIEGRVEWACSQLRELVDFKFPAVVLDSSIDPKKDDEVLNWLACWDPDAKEPSLISLLSIVWPAAVKQYKKFCKAANAGSGNEGFPFYSELTRLEGWPEVLCNQQSIRKLLLPVKDHPIRLGRRNMSYRIDRSKPEAYSANEHITLTPEKLLKASIILGFKRTRTRDLAAIISGLNTDPGCLDSLESKQDLEALRTAQDSVLDIHNWRAFIDSINASGYIGGRFISSEQNLMFAYVLFLIGKTECNVNDANLMPAIARWFFISNLTRRHLMEKEMMESSISKFREIRNGDEFLSVLGELSDSDSYSCLKSEGFWISTLPEALETSSVSSSLQFSYWASLIILDANVLGSQAPISNFLNPSIHAKDKPIAACDWFFSRKDLESTGDIEFFTTNRVGNFALTERPLRTSREWDGNSFGIERTTLLSVGQLRQAHHWHSRRTRRWHAIPSGWQDMEYGDFLKERCELIAAVIREACLKLGSAASNRNQGSQDLIAAERLLHSPNDFEDVEFKPTLRRNRRTHREDREVERSSLRTIVGFLNSRGGALILGASKTGEPEFCEAEIFVTRDNMWLHLVTLLNDHIGTIPSSAHASRIPFDRGSWPYERNESVNGPMDCIHPRFETVSGAWVLRVNCLKSSAPVYLMDGNQGRLFVRRNSLTEELAGENASKYIEEHFPDWRP